MSFYLVPFILIRIHISFHFAPIFIFHSTTLVYVPNKFKTDHINSDLRRSIIPDWCEHCCTLLPVYVRAEDCSLHQVHYVVSPQSRLVKQCIHMCIRVRASALKF